MQNPGAIRGFHAHIYYDADQVGEAQAFAERARAHFRIAVGRFHLAAVGPHPRGSCQLSMSPETFAAFTLWAMHERGDLTIFCHGLSGNDLADHTRYVLWLGPSEPLDLSIFG
ncbi:DOPA 4,5-dioxygenase family protein [Erythrobacter donghaensis]|jgi:DOPA 4,5-dioxygenase|uniref:DOPA 4,5-dioxygenase family protein n=1 Tax=Erythrobacter donghaensis TaxID=267135 RepID=UPI00093AB64C|nr:DOPA 4,5-dioxygenase family protein [Erythrobacter donghaensis]